MRGRLFRSRLADGSQIINFHLPQLGNAAQPPLCFQQEPWVSVEICNPIPAASAHCKYSPTVLFEILQAPAMARFDRPVSYFNRRISLIFREVNRS